MDGSNAALIDGNVIRDGEAGIVIVRATSPTVTDNDIEVSGRAIDIGRGSGGVVTGNVACGGEANIHVDADADASVADNETYE